MSSWQVFIPNSYSTVINCHTEVMYPSNTGKCQVKFTWCLSESSVPALTPVHEYPAAGKVQIFGEEAGEGGIAHFGSIQCFSQLKSMVRSRTQVAKCAFSAHNAGPHQSVVADQAVVYR